MAASASLSTHLAVHAPDRFSLHFSRPTLLAPQNRSNRFLINSVKPISRISYSSLPLFNSYRRNLKFGTLGHEHQNESLASFQPCVSGYRESQPHHTNNETNDSQPSQGQPSSLKYLMQAYREAFLDGDRKTMYEIENIMFTVEKEKNELAQKVSAISAEISSGKEKYIRLQADFDNYRKRSEKEKLSTRSNAQGEVIESLLPMVDSFERAKQQIKLETEKEKKIDNSYQGIYKQFVEIMRSLRVAVVPTVGKPFDPKKHEAIGREESQEYEEGIVMEEVRRGFCVGDRLLRPAMVKVSSGSTKRKPLSVSEQAASVAGVDDPR